MSEEHPGTTEDEQAADVLRYAAFFLMGGLIPPEIHVTDAVTLTSWEDAAVEDGFAPGALLRPQDDTA